LTRLLGIDLGTRRIGLAVADTSAGAGARIRPLATIRRSTAERDAAALSTVAAEQRIDEVVLGLPLNMNGSEGEMAERTRQWALEVLSPLGLPVCLRDERLTSESAIGRLSPLRRGRAGGPPTAAQRESHRAAIDREAAAAILQAELDARVGAA
jgi:putative holliday junction resolvase